MNKLLRSHFRWTGTAPGRQGRGFTMIEVLVTLLVLSIGLLGVAKMLSLAMGSTKVSGSRAIASILAASMASSMHADRGYWAAAGAATAFINVTGSNAPNATYSATVLATGTGNASDTTLTSQNGSNAPNCLYSSSNTSPNCSSLQLAAYDLMQWGLQIAKQLPAPTGAAVPANVSCSAVTPVTCTITVTWSENAISALNAQVSASASLAVANDQITLLVEP